MSHLAEELQAVCAEEKGAGKAKITLKSLFDIGHYPGQLILCLHSLELVHLIHDQRLFWSL